ncbi:MAG: hypothetical protein OZ921_12205 [Sorangiineae bacterium]|nr:hypothetical protein [Polyangiaceae bacterium]MEB2323268.1 hypothetical protein [Sorangiineae bacterium]
MSSPSTPWAGASLVALLALIGCDARRAAPTTSDAPSLSGAWRIGAGTNPDGSGYSGRVEVRDAGGNYLIAWEVAGILPYHGVGLRLGDWLAAARAPGDDAELIAYEVDGGHLVGRSAAMRAPGKLGVETLEGRPGVSGSYRIVTARAAGGGSYAGRVTITPTGPSLRLRWELGAATLEGVGLLEGRMLVAGRASSGAGVALYHRAGASLEGRWATSRSATLGSETLERSDAAAD